MKTGKTLQELAAEVQRQMDSKADYIVDTRNLRLDTNERSSRLILTEMNGGDFTVNEITHDQIASRLKIPKSYYQRLRTEHSHLLDENVNVLFRREPEQRMVRTLDGSARAFLSNRFQPLDNYDLMQAVLPTLMEVPEMRIESCELTETRIYIKALFPRIMGEVKKGDAVQSGVVISNSEVGAGALKVEPLVFRLVCLNGMISADYSQKKYHVGRQKEESLDIYRDETIAADNKATWLKIQDTLKASVDQAKFELILESMRKTTEMKIEDNPVKVIERVQKVFGFNESETGNILTHLIQGGDLTGYGLLNAITRTAQDVESYDRSTELERIGGQIITLQPSQWKQLAKAA